MRCDIQLLDSEDKPWFVGERELPSEYMLKLAADRLPMLREKGAEFAQGAIPVFGGGLGSNGTENQRKHELEFALLVCDC